MQESPQSERTRANSTLAYDRNFARVESADASRVVLSFTLDTETWPWLSLPPQHIVLMEKYQYFSSVNAGWASGLFDPTVYSALTGFSWQCPRLYPDCGPGTRAVIVNRETTDGIIMDIDLYDDDKRHLVHMECVGASFGDRDFKAWRATTRQKALELAGSFTVEYASPEQLGLGINGIPLVSRLRNEDGQPVVTALVTRENGFHPAHPFHTGSGDHVNVGHYLDCVMQMSHLALSPCEPLQCTGGESTFMRFVELDVPFDIHLLAQERRGSSDVKLDFLITQLSRDNARISLIFKDSNQ